MAKKFVGRSAAYVKTLITVSVPRVHVGTCTLALAAVLTVSADAQTVTTLDLGTLGGPNSRATYLNNRGEVVGWSDLGPTSSEAHAFYWRADVGMRDLGTLGGTSSTATRINHVGQVIGTSTTGSGATHGFFWSEATGMLDLGPFIPSDLNERGQVVGNAPSPGGPSHAFVWSQAMGMVDLGTLGGASSGVSQTGRHLISDAGEVIGTRQTLGGAQRGFYWTAAGGMVDLDTRVGGMGNQATDIDDAGRIWGSDGPSWADQFVWTAEAGKQHVLVSSPFPPSPFITTSFLVSAVNDTGSAVGPLFVTPNVFAGVWTVGNPARVVSLTADRLGLDINDVGSILTFDGGMYYGGFGVRSLLSTATSERGIVFVNAVSNAGAAGDSLTTFDSGPRHAVYWCQPDSGPIVTDVGATPTTLTPVDGRMVTVRVSYRTWAPCGGSVTRGLSVTSDQTVTGDAVVVDSNTVQLRASSTGGTGRTYTIHVRVTDASGAAATRRVTVTVPPGGGGGGPMTGITLTANPTSPQPVGTPITLFAVGTGGTTPYAYRFWAQAWKGDWQVMRDWGPTPTHVWTPTVASGYSVWVQGRSAGATTVETQTGINFEIRADGSGGGGGPMSGVTLTTKPESPQPAGTSITLFASGTGGTTPYAFRFWVQPWNGDWQLVRDWAPSATHTWTPTTAGGYNVWVQGRSAGGTNVEVQTGVNFEIAASGGGGGPMTGIELTTNVTSPQRPGTPITLAATGTGGTTPYSFRFWVQPWGGDWQLVRDWETSPTHTWNPATPGGYNVWVQSRSSGASLVEVETGVNFEIR